MNLVFLLVMVIIEENIDFSLTEYFVFVLDNKRSRLSPPTLLAVFNCQPAAGRLPKNDMSRNWHPTPGTTTSRRGGKSTDINNT